MKSFMTSTFYNSRYKLKKSVRSLNKRHNQARATDVWFLVQNTTGAVADKVVFISAGLSDDPAVSVTLRDLAINPH